MAASGIIEDFTNTETPPRSNGSLCFQSWKTETRKQWKRKDDSGGGGWRLRMEVMITVFCSSLYCLLCQCVSLNSQASKVQQFSRGVEAYQYYYTENVQVQVQLLKYWKFVRYLLKLYFVRLYGFHGFMIANE